MGFKREEIRDTSPLSLKKLNDNIRYLWLKVFKGVDFGDLSTDTQNIINSKLGLMYVGQESYLENGPHVIQLPDNFKNTDFQVTLSVSQAYAKGLKGTEMLRYFEVRLDDEAPYDKANGTFTIQVAGMSTELYLNPVDNSIFYIDNDNGIGLNLTYTAIA